MRKYGCCTERNLAVCLPLLLALVMSIFVPGRAGAQVAGATLSGTVTDPSGAAVPNAQISIKDTEKGITTNATTNADGYYSVSNLQPANYEVTVSATGFSTQVMSNITLSVGANQSLPIKLKIGTAAQTVTVTESAPIVNLTSSQISGEVDSTTVRELPLNGRDWTTLATLQPGVVSNAALQPSASGSNGLGGFARGQRGFGLQLSVNGGRPEQNNYRIDGISVNDYANGGPGTALGATMGVEAVQEFTVLTSNYSAEYGRTSGGVVNALTKSGTNQIHGDVFEFIRNSAMDARSFFDPASVDPKIPLFHRNQFGGALGAPIRKDKTFIFGTYEGFRQGKGVTASPTVPTQDTRNGLLNYANPSQFPTDCIATAVANQCKVTVNPLVVPYLQLWPLPNDGIAGPRNSGSYANTGTQTFSEDFMHIRMDNKFSDNDSMYGTYQYDHSTFTGPDALGDVRSGSFTHRHFLALQETHIFTPTFINSVRFGFNRNTALVSAGQAALLAAAGDPTLGVTSGHNAPVIQVGGLANFTGGVNSNTHSFPLINSFQGYDDASLTKGNHTIKFGFSVERIQTNITGYPSGGTFKFGGLYQFLTNQPSSFINAPPPSQAPGYAYRQTIYGAYVQDDYRWKPNLTFNLGLRYEMSTIPNEHYGREAVLQGLSDPSIVPGRAYFSANPTLKNFEPRVGFAWDPFGDGKTSVRSGFGIYDVLPLAYYFYTSAGGPPFTPAVGQAPQPLLQGSFPTGAYMSAQTSPLTSNMYIENHPKRNYVMQWNLSVEHQFGPSLAATITYAGSRAVHQAMHGDDLNEVIPTMTSAGLLWPCGPDGKPADGCAVGYSPAGTQAAPLHNAVINPTHGRMIGVMWNSSSFYDGLSAEIVKKMSHGLQFQGSYTWSKCIDEGSASLYGDQFGNGVVGMPFFDNNARRGLCDFNIAQNFVFNYTWDIPGPKSLHGPMAYAATGWELGGIFSVRTGTPFTPLIAGDAVGQLNGQNYAVPDRVRSADCATAVNPGNIQNYIKLNCFALPTAPASFASQCSNFASATPLPVGSPVVYCANLLGNSGRNTLVGPGAWDLDLSVFKNNPVRRISETFNVQFRAELFNVFNHPTFAAPVDNSSLYSSSGAAISGAGRIDSLTGDPREIQFAIKMIW